MPDKLKIILLKSKQNYTTARLNTLIDETALLDRIAKALNFGTDILELEFDDVVFVNAIEIGKKIKLLCAEFNSLLIIKERSDIAFVLEADGIALNSSSIDIHSAKHILGENVLIGYNANTLEEAYTAESLGADYIISNSNINVKIPVFSQKALS